jgi:hypothetical protein
VAGNKNSWRDIPTADEFFPVFTAGGSGTRRALPVAALPLPLPPAPLGPQPQMPQPGPTGPTGLPPPPAPLPHARMPLIRRIEDSINDYHAVKKDYYIRFRSRITRLESIASLAAAYVDEYRRVNLPGAKGGPGGHKMRGDQRDVWAASLAHRAAKKAGYLTIMEQWHETGGEAQIPGQGGDVALPARARARRSRSRQERG